MLRLRSLIPVLACAAVIGIGGCGILFPRNTETNVAGLKAFASNDELREYFQQQIGLRNSGLQTIDRAFAGAEDGGGQPESPTTDGDSAGGPPQAAPGSGDDEAENHSGTTVQEEGVDEADVVKTDGDYIYMLSNSYAGDGGAVLRILQAAPDQLEVVSEINIDGWGQDLYLRGDQVVALTSGGGGFFYAGGGGIADDGVAVSGGGGVVGSDGNVSSDGDAAIDEPFAPGEYEFERPYTAVTILDVSDRANPRVTSTTRFDGSQAASRMIDGVLHLVLANYQTYYYDIMPMMGRPELNVAAVDVEDMLPDYERDMPGAESSSGGDLVTWENLYHPIDPDGFGVVTVVSMDTTAADAPFTSVGVVAEPGLVYSSLNALYLTDTAYTFDGSTRTTTDVYKLLYVDNEAVPTASGSVPGRVLNQYSMSEFEGNLRVATTIDGEFFFDPFGGGERTDPVNNVYVLGEADGDEGRVLDVVGSVEDIAPGETIQSARFVGAKGFLVTFEQLDPLFTLDLADPTNPEIVGEWHGPGFSTFMAPMGDNHVLAVGQYVPPPGEFGTWGVQLSIFDVSDFANPTQLSNVVLGGDTGSYSEALWNPKAFTYFAEEGLVALPLSVYGGFVFEPGVDVDVDGGTADGSAGGGSSGSSGGDVDAPPPDDVIDPSEPTDPEKPEDVFFPTGQFEGIVVFRATPEDGLVELGRISTLFEERGFYYPGFSRGVFIGDHVYAVTDFGTRTAPVADLETLSDELFYGPEFTDEPPSTPIDPVPVDPTEPGTIEPMPGDDVSPSGKTNP